MPRSTPVTSRSARRSWTTPAIWPPRPTPQPGDPVDPAAAKAEHQAAHTAYDAVYHQWSYNPDCLEADPASLAGLRDTVAAAAQAKLATAEQQITALQSEPVLTQPHHQDAGAEAELAAALRAEPANPQIANTARRPTRQPVSWDTERDRQRLDPSIARRAANRDAEHASRDRSHWTPNPPTHRGGPSHGR